MLEDIDDGRFFMDSLYGILGNLGIPVEVTRDFVRDTVCEKIHDNNAMVMITDDVADKEQRQIFKSILADINKVGYKYIPFYTDDGSGPTYFGYYQPFVIIIDGKQSSPNTEVLADNLRGKYRNIAIINIDEDTCNRGVLFDDEEGSRDKWHYFINPSPRTNSERRRRELSGEIIVSKNDEEIGESWIEYPSDTQGGQKDFQPTSFGWKFDESKNIKQ